jgi:hypothetical protein
MRRFVLAALIFGLLTNLTNQRVLPLHASTGTTRYVHPTGADFGDCTQPWAPCQSIQYAVNQSVAGDQILVAAGIYQYKPSVDPCPFLLTRAVVCFVDKRLAIIGGFSPANWAVRDPTTYQTVIDGQSNYRGVAAIGYLVPDQAHLRMEGFVIQNCRAQGPTYLSPYDPSGVGGGMLIQHASADLSDIIFRNNEVYGAHTSNAGGQADGSALRMEEPRGTSYIRRVIFENNRSYGGQGSQRGGIAFGALYIYKGNVVVEDSQFINNLAQAGSTSGPGYYCCPPYADALGGGITLMQGNLTLRRIIVSGNRVVGGNASMSGGTGGGGYGGGIFIEDFNSNTTQAYISDSYIFNNTAIAGTAHQGGNAAGGGIDIDSASVTIERSYIISNTAIGGNGTNKGPGGGGGIYAFAVRNGHFPLTLKNVVIARNFADQGTGGTNLGNGGGGGITIHGIPASLDHVTIAHNRIGNNLVLGQGLLIQPWPGPSNPTYPGSASLVNSLIADHTGGHSWAAAVVVQQGSSLSFADGLFANNARDTNSTGTPVMPGTISGLSTMQSAPSANFIAPSAPHYNYRLRVTSPARDAASITSLTHDIDGQGRPFTVKADYGADEYYHLPLFFVPGNGTIQLIWGPGGHFLQGALNSYRVHLVSCASGANSPNEVGCGSSVNVGLNTSFTATGVTNLLRYKFRVEVYDAGNNLVATTEDVDAFATSLRALFPVVRR